MSEKNEKTYVWVDVDVKKKLGRFGTANQSLREVLKKLVEFAEEEGWKAEEDNNE